MSFAASETHLESRSWQQQLAEAFTTIEALCAYLRVNPGDLPVSQQAARNFPLKVPLSFAANMAKSNPDDPLLRQVLPVSDELTEFPGFVNDPVGDLEAAVLPGLLHKYHGRVLLINTGACAINCRYCFRRNFPYGEQQLGRQDEQKALDHIRSNPGITEVILSGGDPLALSDARLEFLFTQLAAMPHVKRIRLHSRLPIVLPARITHSFVDLCRQNVKPVVLVVHCNHPNELSAEVNKALKPMKLNGVTLLNQSVLLKGVNDDADILCHLSEKLFYFGILPYYLHQLDKAKGTGHFAVADEVALALITFMQNRLPGYLVPKLVREIAGAQAKQAVNPESIGLNEKVF